MPDGERGGAQTLAVEQLPLRPNMLLTNARATSSTFGSLSAEHCVVTGSNFFNTLFHRTSLEGSSFVGCEFDGALLENCSLRGVALRDCEIDGLTIDGVDVAALVRAQKGGDR